MNTVSNCDFYGVKWDGKAVESVIVVAEALRENAKAIEANAKSIQSLIEVFKAQNVEIQCLLKVEHNKEKDTQ